MGGVGGTGFKYCYPFVWITMSAFRTTGFSYRGGCPVGEVLTGRIFLGGRLLKRVFDIDLEHCPQCGGDFKIIAAIEESAVIVKILTHLGLPARAPPRSPARPALAHGGESASKPAPRGDTAADKPAREENFRQTPRKLIASRSVDAVAQGEKGG